MNRIARRSAAEAAEALLEAGRTQPVLNYDVELGLARHHHWLRSEAPLPEWASATAGAAAKSMVPIVTKTIVSAVLVGALAVAAWQARGRPQPSAADGNRSALGTERTRAVAPSARDLPASEEGIAPRPIPVPDHGLHNDPPIHRSGRADAPDKRTNRFARAHKELAAARAASASATPDAEPAAPATAHASEAVSAERATQVEVAATPESKPATNKARPEAEAKAQAPDDLVEMQQVAKAERLLQRSPERALALVRQGDQSFARGYFQQERAYIAIMALIRLGRIEEARARAASFAKQFPARPYGARIQSALDAAR